MHDSVRVRSSDGGDHGHDDVGQLRERDLAIAFEHRAQGLAIQQLHDDRRGPILRIDDLEDADDVVMAHSRRHPPLVQKPLTELRTAGILHQLHRAALTGPDVLGRPDHTHATLGDEALETIPHTDQRSRFQYHPQVE